MKTGGGTSGTNRWGDYSGAAVDPADSSAVWLFGEYAASPANTWGTYVGQIRAAACQAPPAPVAGNNGPLTTGQALYLTASSIPGATYSWVGPNSFTSNQQNPVMLHVTAAASGTYVVSVAVAGCSSPAASTAVTVHDCVHCPRTIPFR